MPAEVNFSNAGAADRPSPSIWADCPKTLLNDLGLGVYAEEDFVGGPGIPSGTTVTAAIVASMSWGPTSLILDTDLDDAVITHKASEVKGYLDLQTGATDNDAIGIQAEPFGKIVKNSGNKLWFEARFEIGALADQGFFVGLGEEAQQTVDVVAADCAGLIATNSFIGGQILKDDTDGFDIVYQKDGGTKVQVLATATQATAIDSSDRFNVAADTEFKFGMRFDGHQTIAFYINGVKVATQTVDSTVDQSHTLCPLMALKTGTGAAQSFAVDWIRYAYQERS